MTETMGRTGGAAAFLMGGYSSRPRPADFEDVGARQQQLRAALGQLVTGKAPEKGRLSKVGSLPALAAARPGYCAQDLSQLPNFHSGKDPFVASPMKSRSRCGGPQQGQLQDLLGQLKGATGPVGGGASLAARQPPGAGAEASPSVAGLFSQLAELNKGKAAPSGAGSLGALQRLPTGHRQLSLLEAASQPMLPRGQVGFSASSAQQRLSTGKLGQTSSLPDLHGSMQGSSAAAALKAARASHGLPPMTGDRRKFAGVGSLVTGGLGDLLGDSRRSGAAAPSQPLSSSALGSILGEAKRTELRSKAGLGSVGSLVAGGLKDCLADAKMSRGHGF